MFKLMHGLASVHGAEPYQDRTIVTGIRNQGKHVVAGDADPGAQRKGCQANCGLESKTQGDSQGKLFPRSEEHTSELQSRLHLVCRLLLEKKKKKQNKNHKKKSLANRQPNTSIDTKSTSPQ